MSAAKNVLSAAVLALAAHLAQAQPVAPPPSEAAQVPAQPPTGETSPQAEGEAAPYEVECPEGAGGAEACKVDRDTYVGWRTFHSACHQCHAQGAVGSSFAPSLVVRLQGMPKDLFEERVMNGYHGQVGVMPAFKDNPNVVPRIDALYAYLRARSDGVLPPGKPKRLD